MISTILIRLISAPPAINGIFCVIDAWPTQKALPKTEKTNINIDKSSVWCVLNALKICGTSINVHNDEAAQPNITSNSTI